MWSLRLVYHWRLISVARLAPYWPTYPNAGPSCLLLPGCRFLLMPHAAPSGGLWASSLAGVSLLHQSASRVLHGLLACTAPSSISCSAMESDTLTGPWYLSASRVLWGAFWHGFFYSFPQHAIISLSLGCQVMCFVQINNEDSVLFCLIGSVADCIWFCVIFHHSFSFAVT